MPSSTIMMLYRPKNWEQSRPTFADDASNLKNLENPTMHFAVLSRVKDSIRMIALTHVEEEKDDVIEQNIIELDETSLKDFNVRTDEKRNDLESYTLNVKECNAMINEINDKKFYIIFAHFKQQKEMDRNTMETIIMEFVQQF